MVGNFEVTPLNIPEVLLIKPIVRADERGEFIESYKLSSLGAELGLSHDRLVQGNISWSKMGVLRGMHYQRTYPQAKLVMVTSGRVFDVAVDIRVGSPTFGQWAGAELTRACHEMLWIPEGFAHGFLALTEDAAFSYFVGGHEYAYGDEYGIRWDDPAIGINWPLESLASAPIIHERDLTWPLLADTDPTLLFNHTPTL